MFRAPAAILITLMFVNPAGAQTRTELAGGDTPCEWADGKGHSGKTVCHILEQGTMQGQVSYQTFSIGNRPFTYTIVNEKQAELRDADMRSLWKGKAHVISLYQNGRYIDQIEISDGVTVWLTVQ